MFPFTHAAMLFVLSLLSLLMLHKLRVLHRMLQQTRDRQAHAATWEFRQLEALQALYAELRLERALPATRGWAASPDFLLVLVRHAMAARPACIVECSSGTSTIVLARCLQLAGHGKVYSLEHDARYAAATRAELERHGLSHYAEVIDAPLQPFKIEAQDYAWYAQPALDRLPGIDMLVIDGPPLATGVQARYPAGPLLFPRLQAGAAVFLDDADRPDEKAIVARWRQQFPALRMMDMHCEKGCAAFLVSHLV